MQIYDIPINSLLGVPGSLKDNEGKALLLVNVASHCGLTPQYAGLQELQKTYGERGFSVLGFPCNQFDQEPGTGKKIQEFCSQSYGVTFPLFEKIKVSGEDRHPLYAELTAVADAKGRAGDVEWNFEKFLVSPSGDIVDRFRSLVEPETIADSIEAVLPT
jgi:glutathione peroxidase